MSCALALVVNLSVPVVYMAWPAGRVTTQNSKLNALNIAPLPPEAVGVVLGAHSCWTYGAVQVTDRIVEGK